METGHLYAASAIEQTSNSDPARAMVSNSPFSDVPGTLHDIDDAEDVDPQDIEDLDALFGPSMSRQATRLRSPKTPAVEKSNALEEALAYFDDEPNTPPIPDGSSSFIARQPSDTPPIQVEIPEVTRQTIQERDIALGNLPAPKLEESDLPSKPIPSPPQSSLQSVFGTEGDHGERKRSFSGSAAALKNLLPKGLSSMAQVSSMFGTTSAKTGRPSSPSKIPRRLGAALSVGSSNSGESTPIASPRNPKYVFS
jgi:hypothetical protein